MTNTTPQTFTTQLCSDGWYVLREDGTTLAIVPDLDTLGKWTADTLANLMNGRDKACAGWQAADAELAQLRAELARLKPLAEAAVAFLKADDLVNQLLTPAGYDFASVCRSGDARDKLRDAALAYARAQAQDGAA